MRVPSSLFVVVLLGLCLASPAPAWAKPKHTHFEDMIKQSPTIVVATLHGLPEFGKHTAQLEILQVLRGEIKPGKYQVAYEDMPLIRGKGEEFVAFLDKDLIWRFAASPIDANGKVSQTVLGVHGFYDYNAHFVTPGLVTLEQLKTYIKDGTLVYRFRGEVYFPQPGKLAWAPGTLTVAGTYDAVSKKASVKGLPKLEGFPAPPKVDVHSWHDPSIDLTFAGGGERPLALLGKAHGLDAKTGEVLVHFAVSQPEVLTQPAFEAYLADPLKGSCYATFKLAVAPTKEQPQPPVLKLTVGKWTEDEWYTIQLEGWVARPLRVIGTSYNGPDLRSGSAAVGSSGRVPRTVSEEMAREDYVLRMLVRTAAGDYLLLAFDVGKPRAGENVFTWTFQNELLYALYTRQVPGMLSMHNEKGTRTVARFTTTLDSVSFNRIER